MFSQGSWQGGVSLNNLALCVQCREPSSVPVRDSSTCSQYDVDEYCRLSIFGGRKKEMDWGSCSVILRVVSGELKYPDMGRQDSRAQHVGRCIQVWGKKCTYGEASMCDSPRALGQQLLGPGSCGFPWTAGPHGLRLYGLCSLGGGVGCIHPWSTGAWAAMEIIKGMWGLLPGTMCCIAECPESEPLRKVERIWTSCWDAWGAFCWSKGTGSINQLGRPLTRGTGLVELNNIFSSYSKPKNELWFLRIV